MEPHQKLEIFLPKLLAALEHKGVSEAAITMIWKSVMAGSKQPPIETIEHYQSAWTACDTAADILTSLDDGSQAAAWCCALSRQILILSVPIKHYTVIPSYIRAAQMSPMAPWAAPNGQ